MLIAETGEAGRFLPARLFPGLRLNHPQNLPPLGGGNWERFQPAENGVGMNRGDLAGQFCPCGRAFRRSYDETDHVPPPFSVSVIVWHTELG